MTIQTRSAARLSALAALLAASPAAFAQGPRVPPGSGPDGPNWVQSGNNLNFTAGNVSIGSTNPAYRLYVVGSTPAAIVGTTDNANLVAVGVQGQSASSLGRGVYGYATASTGGAYGGLFRTLSNQGIGVFALADATTGPTAGIRGQAASSSGTGLWGNATSATGQTNGIYGRSVSNEGAGVFGLATSPTGVTYGVYGETTSLGDGFGVYSVGDTAATGLKLFQIDHPLDPANRMLNHFSAEGPEPYLIYRGTAIMDQFGAAIVQLPDYFDAINRDPHYQLTPIGAPAVLYIAQEVVNNRFIIAGGKPGMKVSWTVTGIRNDAFVQRYGAREETFKTPAQRGKFLHPELYGQPASRAIRNKPVELDSDPSP